MAQALARNEQKLVPVVSNLVDLVWREHGQPPRPAAPVIDLPVRYAGVARADKLAHVRAELARTQRSALVLTALDEIAWLFNLRGGDVEYNPVFHAYAAVPAAADTPAVLFVDVHKLSPEAAAGLIGVADVHPYDDFFAYLADTVPQWITGWSVLEEFFFFLRFINLASSGPRVDGQ